MKYTIKDVEKYLPVNHRIIGNPNGKYFTNVKPIESVNNETLDWVNPIKDNKQELVENSKAMIIICDDSIVVNDFLEKNKCLLVVDDPKLTFIRIVNALFVHEPKYGIHHSAVIHSDAKISPKCYIGPHSYIGMCSIGEGVIIYGNSYLHDNVTIGNNVIIHAGVVIGGDGFGYSRNSNNEFEKFPHIGGVIIEDNVEIGANTCIDKGALGNTIIKTGAKIDNLVHIAHNVIVGENSAVIANSMVGGSTKIGKNAWVAPSASLRDQIEVGEDTVVGMGSVVTKNIPNNEIWTGSPAKELSEFKLLQDKLKKI